MCTFSSLRFRRLGSVVGTVRQVFLHTVQSGRVGQAHFLSESGGMGSSSQDCPRRHPGAVRAGAVKVDGCLNAQGSGSKDRPTASARPPLGFNIYFINKPESISKQISAIFLHEILMYFIEISIEILLTDSNSNDSAQRSSAPPPHSIQ